MNLSNALLFPSMNFNGITRGLLSIVLLAAVVFSSSSQSFAKESGHKETIGKQRALLFKENPWLIHSIRRGGFGNNFSPAIANHMYSRDNQAAIQAARDGLEINEIAARTWVFEFPIECGRF